MHVAERHHACRGGVHGRHLGRGAPHSDASVRRDGRIHSILMFRYFVGLAGAEKSRTDVCTVLCQIYPDESLLKSDVNSTAKVSGSSTQESGVSTSHYSTCLPRWCRDLSPCQDQIQDPDSARSSGAGSGARGRGASAASIAPSHKR